MHVLTAQWLIRKLWQLYISVPAAGCKPTEGTVFAGTDSCHPSQRYQLVLRACSRWSQRARTGPTWVTAPASTPQPAAPGALESEKAKKAPPNSSSTLGMMNYASLNGVAGAITGAHLGHRARKHCPAGRAGRTGEREREEGAAEQQQHARGDERGGRPARALEYEAPGDHERDRRVAGRDRDVRQHALHVVGFRYKV